MALTALQRDVCRLLAADRRRSGESYVAGGAALSVALQTSRLSRDVDVFHDTIEAVGRSWDRDRTTLEREGYIVTPVRERPGYVEATVSRADQRLVIEWSRDSAFRFFPLVEHEDLGLVLHPFDLATNKVLALVGRLEARDWVDVIACHTQLQPLGYLAWAASGKDPGFAPMGILEQAGRTSRYTQDEISSLAFEGTPPDARVLARQWHEALTGAADIIGRLPAEHVGQAVLAKGGRLFGSGVHELERALRGNELEFHRGRIGGAWPYVKGG